MTGLTTARPLHDLTLGDVSRSNARRFASWTATLDGDSTCDFAALEHRVGRLAAELRARGVSRGDVVAWLGQGSSWFLVALLGAARLGAALAPLSWRLTSAELDPLLASLCPAATLRHAEEAAAWSDGDGPTVDDDAEGVTEDDPVLLVLTAAFAGEPLAAELTHRGLLTQSLLLAARDDVGPESTYLASGMLAHIGPVQYVLAHWLVGGRVVFLPKMDAAAVVDLVERERVTGAFLVPASIPELVAAAEERGRNLSSLRTPALAGDEVLERWTDMTSRPRGSGGLGTSTGYGQTEVTGLATSVALGRGPSGGNAGWPQHAAVVRVVRPGSLDEAAIGEVGEIVVRGPLVMAGYRGVDMSARWQGGWHRTGDLGRYEADGSLHFVGPALEMIKTGGENVYPAEVEAALREHPAVVDVAVVGLDDARWGQTVAALLVGDVDVADVRRWCAGRLAGYKRPRRWLVTEALPRTVSGQVDRAQIAVLLSQVGTGA